jgi:bla regulator protein blaR1
MNTGRTIAIVCVLGSAAMVFAVHAQAPPSAMPRLTFEVASVKPNKSGAPRVMVRSEPGGRFTATNVTPRVLIRNAYSITEDSRIVDAPGWIGTERFDVVARTVADVPLMIPGQAVGPMNLMLQALLEDRFQLRVHHESRELPLFVLAFATTDRRPGLRLAPTSVDCEAVLAKLYPASGPAPPPPPFVPGQPPPCGSTGGPGQILAQGMTMAQLASNLSSRVNRVVVDKTGLIGNFDINLEWMPDQFQGAGPLGALPGAPPPSSDTQAPSIYTALQEQLGLKLESTKGPVDVLVVDRIDLPTPD